MSGLGGHGDRDDKRGGLAASLDKPPIVLLIPMNVLKQGYASKTGVVSELEQGRGVGSKATRRRQQRSERHGRVFSTDESLA